jgi:hypothetical protein
MRETHATECASKESKADKVGEADVEFAALVVLSDKQRSAFKGQHGLDRGEIASSNVPGGSAASMMPMMNLHARRPP